MANEAKSETEVVAPATETQPAPLAPWIRLAGPRGGIGEVVARIRARLGTVQR